MSRRKSKKRIVNQEGLKGRQPEIKANTRYKDTVFRMLFRDKEQLSIDQAVDKAVDECIAENILREFLLRNRAEVRQVSIFEYNEEDTRRAIGEYQHGQGVIESKIDDVLLLLKRKGAVPADLEKEILEESDIEVLQNWLISAAEVKSIDEFIERK